MAGFLYFGYNYTEDNSSNDSRRKGMMVYGYSIILFHKQGGLMKQITIHVDDDQHANQIINMLSGLAFINEKNVDVTSVWSTNGNGHHATAQIMESDRGPMISHSRVSVYDVMDADDEGYTPRQIEEIYNLSSEQVAVALDYIHENSAWLVPKLLEIQKKKAKREAHYRALAAERKEQATLEMTPRRQQLQELIVKSRQMRESI